MSGRRRVGSLFSGIGGLDLAVEQFFDAETVWHAEYDPEPSKVLAAPCPGVPNFGDVTKVDWSQVEPVDIMCGGFPCQDLSLAGRRSGMRPGTRSGLWADFKAAIAVLRPSVVVIENVRGLLSGCAESDSDLEPCQGCLGISNIHRPLVRALGRVLGDLAALGFDAEWQAVSASDVGAPHGRFRVFVVAHARGIRLGSWRVAGTGETSSRRSSAVNSGRGGAPVTLLPTPLVSDQNGPSADHRREHLPLRSIPLPTPSASSPNEEEDIETWTARRAAIKASGLNGNGFGMPLGVAVRLLPTPVTQPNTGNGHARNLGKEIRLLPTPMTTDGGSNSPGDQARRTPGLRTIPALLPTSQVADAEGGHASRSGDRSGELLLPGVARAATAGHLLPTPRASDGEHGGPNQRGSRGDLTVSSAVGTASWGQYEPAVSLWESLTRPAPAPTLPDGKAGAERLSPLLPEWMMGYSDGWVTDILERNPAIKACGNGVVPQQAFHALGMLWPRVVKNEVAA